MTASRLLCLPSSDAEPRSSTSAGLSAISDSTEMNAKNGLEGSRGELWGILQEKAGGQCCFDLLGGLCFRFDATPFFGKPIAWKGEPGRITASGCDLFTLERLATVIASSR
jgi:hypothetical protein